jgi:hypothetical protein
MPPPSDRFQDRGSSARGRRARMTGEKLSPRLSSERASDGLRAVGSCDETTAPAPLVYAVQSERRQDRAVVLALEVANGLASPSRSCLD